MSVGNGRTLTFSFAKLLASNSYTPAWAKTGSTESAISLNIYNLFYVPTGKDRNSEYTFTTRMGALVGGIGFHMVNPSPDAPSSAPNLPIANVPYTNSLVVVHYCPGNTNTSTCPNIVHETWFVHPDPNPTGSGTSSQTGLPLTQVGFLVINSNRSNVNAGEFSMPFSFTISLLN